ncbi:MAG: ParB N-terminal domain-containing protein [Desulfobacterales bacterium]|nr:ParB N-terminal domain-containing protein [Desulfobacterales bacterium]
MKVKSYRIIRLSHIDSEDDSYRITTNTKLDDLTDSIKNVGLLNPPLLIEKSETFRIISGFRRTEACKKLGWSDIQAWVADPDTEKLECVKCAVTDNALQRPLNLIETSRSLKMLSDFFKDYKELARTASELGLPGNLSVIKKVENLCLLPLPIQNAILSDTIPLTIALELEQLEKNTAIAFAKLFDDLKPSLNKQREIIILVKEIAAREDTSVAEILQETCLQEISGNHELNRNQKTGKIRSYLKKRRFPSITNAEEKFGKLVQELKLGNNANIIPPSNFEGTLYSLNLHFANLEDLEKHWTTIEKMIKNPALVKMFER